MATNKQEYLIKKGLIPNPVFGKLYVVFSNRDGAILKNREVWDIVDGPKRRYADEKEWISSKKYIMKDDFPYHADIYEGKTSGEDHGYASGFGDLWGWSYFVFLDEKEAQEKLRIENERINKKYKQQ